MRNRVLVVNLQELHQIVERELNVPGLAFNDVELFNDYQRLRGFKKISMRRRGETPEGSILVLLSGVVSDERANKFINCLTRDGLLKRLG